VALPDPELCFAAMRRLSLAVHIATKLNRSHLLIGGDAIILPCLGRTEKDMQAEGQQSVTVEDSMSMVHASRGNLPPASPLLRSEPAIVAGMAAATLPASRVEWAWMIADYDRIRDAIEGVFPDFADFNTRIRTPGGFRLPLPPTELKWETKSGKAEFLVFAGLREDPHVNDPNVLTMTTIRSHDQYNTTIYGMDDRYRGVFGRRDVMFMNEEDMTRLGLSHGDKVDIVAMRDPGENTAAELAVKGVTAIAYGIARGSVAGYYPEMNGLIALSHHDVQSGTPGYKSVPVRITRSRE